jgi:uncharacterized protein YpbB
VLKKILNIQSARLGDVLLNPSEVRITLDKEEKSERKGKVEKGSSLQETLTLFLQGNSVMQIAEKRNLAFSTIEGHIAMLVKTGEVDIHKVVSEPKLSEIISAIGDLPASSLGVIKAKLGDDYSFGEIRAVMNHLDFQADLSNWEEYSNNILPALDPAKRNAHLIFCIR